MKSDLKDQGYERQITSSNPPLTAEHMRALKNCVEEHISWNHEQWSQILWTDETWVNGPRYSRVGVTRKVGAQIRSYNKENILQDLSVMKPISQIVLLQR